MEMSFSLSELLQCSNRDVGAQGEALKLSWLTKLPFSNLLFDFTKWKVKLTWPILELAAITGY